MSADPATPPDGAGKADATIARSGGRRGGLDQICIRGGHRLEGAIQIGGAKNATLPLMAASLLTGETLALSNVPYLADITTMANMLVQLGVEVGVNGENGVRHGRTLELSAREIADTTAPYDLVRKMRASVLVLGPLLARCGAARVSQPGGCAIGTRPIDLHLAGMERLGAEIVLEEGYIHATAPGGLAGAEIVFPTVSVGATENLMMAATLAKGETRLVNAACEPEIVDLAKCLSAMGAEIEGAGGAEIVIHGVEKLGGAEHTVMPDRIEIGTYAIAAAITGGNIELQGADIGLIGALRQALEATGVDVEETAAGVRVAARNGRIESVHMTTAPYPGFPTDLQAQWMALMATAEGEAKITETIFENRFMHVPELSRMGADIKLDGGAAVVRGVARLKGAPVMATDLRASVSLVLAGLAAEGETFVSRIYHLDRGYERFEEKLAACGAEIERDIG